MALTDMQVRQLRAKLDGRHVKTRNANGVELHYVEGWHVIAEANRIFGYDAWDRRTLATNCVSSSRNWAASSCRLHREGSDHRAGWRNNYRERGIRNRRRQSPYPR